MQLGFIGLGKMGGNMVLRLTVGSTDGQGGGGSTGGHTVVGYAPDPNPDLAGVEAVQLAGGLDQLVATLTPPRVVWIMVPAGKATESVITDLSKRLAAGDLLIDGGNSYYKDSIRRAEGLAKHGIGFLDVGTSGGIWGRAEGYCMMVGGRSEDVQRAKPIFDTLAPADGWAHMGPNGSGHFVKMIHNGIEYGLMESYGEGFEILRKSKFGLDLHKVAHVWNRGSVIRSWLLELSERMLEEDSTLQSIQPYVEDSGEGRWTVAAAIEENVPVPVIAASLFARFESRDKENYSARFAAALRKQFGGHDVVRKDLTTKTEPEQRTLHTDGSAEPST
ncbi:MAG TPA: decarboxylating 6-phosphogluconate dehydrogenase [Tepidisphaeraceae bacterium]|nr:decarboxylating 6-phosphogluconate dehydrogenase [Tepidisphaeraceae bacterium]